MFCNFRHGFDCLRNGEGTPHPTPGRAPSRSPLRRGEGMRVGERLFGCGVWVCILSVGFWVGDGGPGLGCRISMAPTPTLAASAAVLPFPSRMPWETCRCRGRLCVGTSVLRISARPLSGTAYRLEAAVGGWSRIRALRPCITSARLAEFLGEG